MRLVGIGRNTAKHKSEKGSYVVYILIQNFESESKKLVFDKFSITRIDNSNYEELRAIFESVNRSGQHFIERRYDEVPRLPEGEEDFSGLGRIPYDSEELMLLLRLFKTGDIVSMAQIIKRPDGDPLRQYQYPMVFSQYHSPQHYKMSEEEILIFNAFYVEAAKWPGWHSEWFKIARRYFLWGGSKEFYPGRDNERILDYMIALEASFVPEGDFVSRRLKERTAAILQEGEEKSSFRKRMDSFYGIRSALAHGSPLSSKQTRILEEKMTLFEEDIRRLLKVVLKRCPSREDGRRRYLSGLYDISDVERAKKIISDFGAIEDPKIKGELLKRLSG